MVRGAFWSLLASVILLFLPTGVAAKAERIVALAPHIVESLFEIGAGDKVIATVDYADYPAQALEIPRVGGYYGVQMERILELQPDLVIVWKTGNKQEDIEKLKKLGLNIAYSEAQDIEGVAQELLHLGQLTGHQQQARGAANAFTQRLVELREKYAGKAPIKTFYQLWSEPMMTVNKNTWIHQLLTVCGAQNVFADASTDYPQISLENVVVASPELIIVPDEKSDKPQPSINWQKWPMIPAVKNDHFVSVNADLIHRFSSRMLTGLEDMCRKVDQLR